MGTPGLGLHEVRGCIVDAILAHVHVSEPQAEGAIDRVKDARDHEIPGVGEPRERNARKLGNRHHDVHVERCEQGEEYAEDLERLIFDL